jgi:Mrp family chromosome partitioning ATPase
MSRKRTGAVSYGLFAGALVFVLFGTYARFAPTTYVATARVVLEPIPPQPLVLPPPAVAATQLTNAALDAEGLALIGNELELTRDRSAEVHEHIRAALTIAPAGTGTFSVTVSDSGAVRAQRLCNLVASRAAAKAMFVLAPREGDTAAKVEAARRARKAKLDAFLAAHPELNAPTIAPLASARPNPEAEIAALRAERDQLAARLEQSAGDTDNPYGEGASPDTVRLERRLKEIDSRIEKLRGSDAKAAPKIDPALQNELRRLREAAEGAIEPPAQPTVQFTPRMIAATMPSSPIKPDRRLVLILGVAASLLAGIAVGLFRRVVLRRQPPPSNRRISSRPPGFSSDPPGRVSSNPPGRISSSPPHIGSNPPYGEPPRHISSNPPYGEPPRHISSNPPPGELARPGSSAPPAYAPAAPHAQVPAPLEASGFGTATLPSAGVESPLVQAGTSAAPIIPIAPIIPPVVPFEEAPRTVPMNPRPSAQHTDREPLPGSRTPSSTPPRAPNAGEHDAPLVPVPIFPGTRTPLSSAPPAPPDPAFARRRKDEPFGASPSARASATPTIPPPPLEQQPEQAIEGIVVSASEGPPRPAGPQATNAFAATLPEAGAASPFEPPRPGRPAKKHTLAGPFTPEVQQIERKEPAPAATEGRKRPGRTTQMLGSPIPPTARDSYPPRRATPTEVTQQSVMPPAAPRTPTGYSFANEPERLQGITRTPPAPRYVSTAPQSQSRRGAPAAEAKPARPTIRTRRAHAGWSPDPSITPGARRELVDQLIPFVVDGCFVLGVSAVPEARAQKTRVSCEIALALAEARHPRVLLIEGDFQWPIVHELMRIEMPFSLGYSQQLRSSEPPETRGWTVVECGPSLHVIGEGIMRSPGLILSNHFEDSLRSFRSVYDIVVIDGPPISSEADCRALDSLVDGLVLVSPETGSPGLVHAGSIFSEKRFSTVVPVAATHR